MVLALGLLANGLVHNSRPRLLIDPPLAPVPGGVLLDPGETQLRVTFAPAPGLQPQDAPLFSDLFVLQALGGEQNDLRTLGQPHGGGAAPRELFQFLTLGVVEHDGDGFSYAIPNAPGPQHVPLNAATCTSV
jgi:hypothetical protein